jgi:hypothetical protein
VLRISKFRDRVSLICRVCQTLDNAGEYSKLTRNRSATASCHAAMSSEPVDESGNHSLQSRNLMLVRSGMEDGLRSRTLVSQEMDASAVFGNRTGEAFANSHCETHSLTNINKMH